MRLLFSKHNRKAKKVGRRQYTDVYSNITDWRLLTITLSTLRVSSSSTNRKYQTNNQITVLKLRRKSHGGSVVQYILHLDVSPGSSLFLVLNQYKLCTARHTCFVYRQKHTFNLLLFLFLFTTLPAFVPPLTLHVFLSKFSQEITQLKLVVFCIVYSRTCE